jgi:hypothetical protein
LPPRCLYSPASRCFSGIFYELHLRADRKTLFNFNEIQAAFVSRFFIKSYLFDDLFFVFYLSIFFKNFLSFIFICLIYLNFYEKFSFFFEVFLQIL